jgi:predicted nuclease with TOPRIM domain
MSDVYHEVAQIQTLAYELVQQFEEATNENDGLRERVTQLQADLDEKARKLELLEQELKAAKIARSMVSNEEDTGLAKARISSLVREIDRCIALLNE